MYRMSAFVVTIRARGYVTFYADNVYVDNVNWYVRFMLFSRL